ncbi:OmpA family protein [Dyadobacter fanqingshengii]|uniref:OmpA family protein n=1 Tax=Dyadobacter fanqingshengii TaxID=2906443 RepID=A0A9X1PB49_9BACT|nr:OmpA family protein [Dyadobacter fanqingshengii]MCF0040418.1 OmpA family protein [Dyadobacter fanqingshengii]MCF2501981.1 OmpA family protein [Dyadobacter fanqingshengii]USJ37840.1 OmpA family protein [Dyadobacter fanqingshengii]
MKKLLLVITFSAYGISCPAQLLDRIKNKVEQKVADQVDHSIDKALEKKKPKENTKPSDSPDSNTQSAETGVDTVKTTTAPNGAPASAVSTDITSYSRFDFIPGSKIIVHEDFSQDEVGDFPANWNTRSGAELVTIDGRQGKWLRINQNGVFYPEYLTSDLPENFTLQLDLLGNKQVSNIGEFMISLMQTSDTDQKFDWGKNNAPGTPSFNISFQPTSSSNGDLRYSSNLIGTQYKHGVPEFNLNKNAVKISIWKQKQRVRVYLDSTKVLDLPRALDASAALNTLTFSSENPDFNQKGGAFFIGNIQLAIGAADTRNKLITEGKFTTHGILFDVNRDQILPQSYGALQDIARIMQENASLRVQIVGHTDADGNDNSNLDLSKRRANAVKEAMISNFNIDGARLETDGKGKAQPIDSNETPVGKANNRRVEFIKL